MDLSQRLGALVEVAKTRHKDALDTCDRILVEVGCLTGEEHIKQMKMVIEASEILFV